MRIRSVVAGAMICSGLFAAGCACPCGKQKQVSITAERMAKDKESGIVTAQGDVKIETGDGTMIEAEKAVITPANK